MTQKPKGIGNVLLNLNVSNDSNFEADSGVVFQREIWSKILECRERMQLFFLGHEKMRKPWRERVNMLPVHTRYDKFSTRFNFDWHGLGDLFDEIPDIDLLINNQPEHTLALRMLLATKEQTPPVLSYYHYLPFHYAEKSMVIDPSQHIGNFSAPFILGRNLEGAEASKWNLIGSSFGQELMHQAYQESRGREFEGHMDILAPPIEENLFEEDASQDGRDRKRILYNQRLYKHYGTKAIIEVFEELAKDHEFQLVVTDPTGNRSKKRDSLDPDVNGFRSRLESLPFVSREHCVTRYEYHRLLSTVDAAVAPIKPSALWSMAVADVLASGHPVFCPDMAAFPEIVPNNKEELLFKDAADLKERLGAFLRDELEFTPADMRSNVVQHRADNVARRLLSIIEQ